MNAHYQEQMPLYVAGQLSLEERAELEEHLRQCPICQGELGFWQELAEGIVESSASIQAPDGLVDRALAHTFGPAPLIRNILRAMGLLRAQAYLVKREIWPASAAVMALGVIVALISNHVEALYFIAPLIAAANLATLYNPQYDPAYELTRSTPTSAWKILLARLSVVSAYNLFVALLASLMMLLILPPELLGMIILGWLAPMAFLSALALLLSLWIGTSNAIAIAYILWIAQFTPYKSVGAWMVSPGWSTAIIAYRQFWHTPGLLLLISVMLLGIALWSANRPTLRLTQSVS